MYKKTISKQIKKISSITIGLLFLWISFTSALDTTTLITSSINTLEEKETDRNKFNKIIEYFCDEIKWYQMTYWEVTYKSNQSLFVYTLCKDKETIDFSKNPGLSEEKNTSYIQIKTDDNGNESNTLDKHLPWLYYNTEKYIQTLFDTIIGSYTSIKQSYIYWYANSSDLSIEEMIHKNFMQEYFQQTNGNYIEICATDKEYQYTKTCKKLKDYFYGARNLINSNSENYLNDENIYKAFRSNEKLCENNDKKDIIACGLYGYDIKSFINTVYNEFLFYSLFVEYYSYLLESNLDFKNIDNTPFDEKIANNKNRVQTMVDNLATSRDAIQTTIKSLKELQYTFPIHIGFLMYTEDIYKFTSALNKTLTPIYTLHDILRNVQKTEQ